MPRTARTARNAALSAAAVAAALTLSACSPAMTIRSYAASDGTLVEIDHQLRGINLMIVSEAEGEPGNLLGALANATDRELEYTLTVDGAAPLQISVEPFHTVYLGTDEGEQAIIDTVTTIPGGYLSATLEADGQSKEFKLPVFDGTLPEYAGSLPTQAPDSATSTPGVSVGGTTAEDIEPDDADDTGATTEGGQG
ncbi:hypothetical protein [Xylanimonas oleitrophica]|uniref:hypothetical protein n=1 Tax=Xylanimonas oleitrophica TaxID=2607479 RepID=UPI0015D02268|nr:hypothetical protein [Xylanimonas oleitrophica]